MIEIPITSDMLELAEYKAQDLGKLKNSIEKGDGNIAGFIGELALSKLLGADIVNTYDYDLIYGGVLTIDAKTKRTGFEPKPYYDASVAAANIKQKCHVYAFGRVLEDYSCYWLCGFYNKRKYYKKAKFCRKGEVDPNSGRKKFKYKADCYSMAYEQMIIPDIVIKYATVKSFDIIE